MTNGSKIFMAATEGAIGKLLEFHPNAMFPQVRRIGAFTVACRKAKTAVEWAACERGVRRLVLDTSTLGWWHTIDDGLTMKGEVGFYFAMARICREREEVLVLEAEHLYHDMMVGGSVVRYDEVHDDLTTAGQAALQCKLSRHHSAA